jgi:hypothetical protein
MLRDECVRLCFLCSRILYGKVSGHSRLIRVLTVTHDVQVPRKVVQCTLGELLGVLL